MHVMDTWPANIYCHHFNVMLSCIASLLQIKHSNTTVKEHYIFFGLADCISLDAYPAWNFYCRDLYTA